MIEPRIRYDRKMNWIWVYLPLFVNSVEQTMTCQIMDYIYRSVLRYDDIEAAKDTFVFCTRPLSEQAFMHGHTRGNN